MSTISVYSRDERKIVANQAAEDSLEIPSSSQFQPKLKGNNICVFEQRLTGREGWALHSCSFLISDKQKDFTNNVQVKTQTANINTRRKWALRQPPLCLVFLWHQQALVLVGVSVALYSSRPLCYSIYMSKHFRRAASSPLILRCSLERSSHPWSLLSFNTSAFPSSPLSPLLPPPSSPPPPDSAPILPSISLFPSISPPTNPAVTTLTTSTAVFRCTLGLNYFSAQ